MNTVFRQIRFPLILFLCLSLAFPPELVAQSYDAAGRAVRTLREVNDVNGTVSASVVTLSQTQYNSIDKSCKVIDEFGVVTVYEYDELGNSVETKTYDNNDGYTAGNIRTISQTLYDKAGRPIVTVDAHVPDANANGTQTVYDVLGRAVETWRLKDVNVPVVDINVGGGIIAYRVDEQSLRKVTSLVLRVGFYTAITLAMRAEMARAAMIPAYATIISTFTRGI